MLHGGSNELFKYFHLKISDEKLLTRMYQNLLDCINDDDDLLPEVLMWNKMHTMYSLLKSLKPLKFNEAITVQVFYECCADFTHVSYMAIVWQASGIFNWDYISYSILKLLEFMCMRNCC